MDATETKPFPWAGLLTLSALIFTAVTSEFLPTGLLPEIARELEVSQSQVGLLVTVFAGTVVVSATPLAIVTRRYSRKSLVIAVLVLFAVANVLAALAPTYAVLVVARIIGGLSHGLFWSVVGAYSAHLVPTHQLARAVAITGGGASVAFVLGVPVGTAVGNALGWRLAFGAIAVVVVVLIAVAARLLPPVTHGVTLATGEIPLPMRRDRTVAPALLISAIVIVVGLGQNMFYTYIAPFLIGPVRIDPGAIAGVLLIYGGAGVLGLLASGTLGDRFPRAAMVGGIGLVIVAVAILGSVPDIPWLALIAIAVWGASFGALPPLLQARMLHTASVRVRDVAASVFTTSFNVAIGLGALVGGIILDRWGVGVLPWVEVAIMAVGLALVVAGNAWLARRDSTSPA